MATRKFWKGFVHFHGKTTKNKNDYFQTPLNKYANNKKFEKSQVHLLTTLTKQFQMQVTGIRTDKRFHGLISKQQSLSNNKGKTIKLIKQLLLVCVSHAVNGTIHTSVCSRNINVNYVTIAEIRKVFCCHSYAKHSN